MTKTIKMMIINNIMMIMIIISGITTTERLWERYTMEEYDEYYMKMMIMNDIMMITITISGTTTTPWKDYEKDNNDNKENYDLNEKQDSDNVFQVLLHSPERVWRRLWRW